MMVNGNGQLGRLMGILCDMRCMAVLLCGGLWAAGSPQVAHAALPSVTERMGLTATVSEPKVYLEITRADASVSKIGPLNERWFDRVRIVAQTPANEHFTVKFEGLRLPDMALGMVLVCDGVRWLSPRFTQPAGGALQDAEFDLQRAAHAWRVARALGTQPNLYPAPLRDGFLRAQQAALMPAEPVEDFPGHPRHPRQVRPPVLAVSMAGG